MPTAIMNLAVSGIGTDSASQSVTVTASAAHDIDETIEANQTNVQINWALDVSALKLLFIVATVAMTLKTNSTGSPGRTIALAPNVPIPWAGAGGDANPFGSTDITTLYVTTGEEGGRLIIKDLYDATP